MKLTPKYYKISKTKDFIKNKDLFIFYNGIHQKSTDWIKTEQGLKIKNLSYYKIFNTTTKIVIQESIYKNISSLINNLTFFIKPKNDTNLVLSKKLLFNLELFSFLAIKINSKVYSLHQVRHLNSFDYYDNKLLLYQFKLTNIKTCLKRKDS